jgi:hypothetical protein
VSVKSVESRLWLKAKKTDVVTEALWRVDTSLVSRVVVVRSKCGGGTASLLAGQPRQAGSLFYIL